MPLAQRLCLPGVVSLLSYPAALCLLLLTGCGAAGAKDRAPVQPLTCTRPAALSGITPTGGDGLCLLSFDTEHMGYAALYGGGEQFFFADAAVFKSTGGDLYAISGAPYLMGVSGSSALYALDVRMADSMDSLICHELWHATENRILSQDYAAIDPDTWDALNPPGFTYCGDTALSNDLRQWTLYSCDPADVCFVDGYACVDAREDRARIMEYFMVHEDAAQLLIESPVIRWKLRLMCSAVRDNFDTTGWGQVRWESLL